MPVSTTPLWVRTVADPLFRENLISDPLATMAAHPEVSAPPGLVRQIDTMTTDERREMITEVVREVYRMRGPTSGKDREIR